MEDKYISIQSVEGGYIVQKHEGGQTVHTSLNNAVKQVKELLKPTESTDESVGTTGQQQLNG
jgi:hypothetical protein